MKVVFTIQHPAHVHLFRKSIQTLRENGHEVYTFARENEIVGDLLDSYEIDHEIIVGEPSTKFPLPLVQLTYETKLLRRALKIRPDVMVAMGEPAITHVSKFVGAESIVFTDTEHATLQNTLAFPFADRICTPTCYQDDIGSKQIRYPGYHELAYLHPDRFEPNPQILTDNGLGKDDPFVILRLVSWDAVHDRGDSGFDNVHDVVSQIEATGTEVLITSEKPLSGQLKDHCITVEPHRIHHLMYYADLYVGESATMATESAVLGTPAVFVSSSRRGYTDELEAEYGLVSNFSEDDRHERGIERAISILNDYDRQSWQRKHDRLLEDKVDTTMFILEMIRSASERSGFETADQSSLGELNRQ